MILSDRPATALAAAAALLLVAPAQAQTDPLPSWNDTAPKAAIVAFVDKVTKEGSADFVPEPERIAVFDNDGTLWVEQPMYIQLAFALDRVKALAPQHPEWKDTQPFKAVLEGDMKALAESRREGPAGADHGDPCRNDHRRVPEDRLRLDRHGARPAVQAALHRARLPADARAARLSARQRLQDLHRLGRRHRVHAPVDREGSTAFRPSRSSARRSRRSSRCATASRPCSACRRSTSSTTRPASRSASTSTSAAVRSPPSAIPTATSRCCSGRRWATAPRFGLIVHHTDAEREYAYDRKSPVGHLDKALDAAQVNEWTVVDMKKDWKVIFPFDLK